MLLSRVLWTLAFTTSAAMTTLQTSPPVTHPPHPMLVSRLERLEHLVTDQQTQFQQEVDRWQKEKQSLREKLDTLLKEKQDMRAEIEALQNDKQTSREAVRLLQEDVHAIQREKQDIMVEIEVLQNAHTLTQTLAAENRDLKSQVVHLQSQMGLMDLQVTSLRNHVAQCGDNAVSPDTAGAQDTGDQHSPREQSARASSISAREGKVRQDGEPTPQHQRDSHPIHHLGDLDPDMQHVQSARSDDQGPLQVVVDHLAATTTQLTSDLQALTSQHASDVQAVSSDVQSLRSQLSSDVQMLRNQITAVQAAQGSVFVQWGSSTCSGSSDLVYTGSVGGSFYDHKGAAANALCLSPSPVPVTKSPAEYSLLYGGEYETIDSHQNSVPMCAVCRSHHASTVMVPGTNVCASGWSLMYSGYLMAGRYDLAAATEFICVDAKLEGAAGSSRNNDNGYLLYYTKAQCGSLPCPPYENNKYVTCAVCAK